jgi:hypothetical protein
LPLALQAGAMEAMSVAARKLIVPSEHSLVLLHFSEMLASPQQHSLSTPAHLLNRLIISLPHRI